MLGCVKVLLKKNNYWENTSETLENKLFSWLHQLI